MKKMLAFITLTIFIMSSTCFAYTVYEEKEETPVSKGVTYIRIKSLDENGWNNINILKADLNEPDLSLKILENSEISKKSTVEGFVSAASDIVGAVNGDFFTNYGDSAACEGLRIKDGELLTTPSNDRSYASLAITESGGFLLDYFTFDISITSGRTGDSTKCLFYNKLASEEYLKIYDSGFGKKSPGSMNDGYEVLVEDGIVTGVFSNSEGIEIPENGYVLHNSLRHSLFLMQNFYIGDEVFLKVEISPDIEEIRDAVGGGTLLLSNGKKTAFSLKDSRQPMTAIGINKKENTVYFLAADGRLEKARGMTFSETAGFLLSLGCTDAISFDGGGSTSMVIKKGGAVSRVNMQTSKRPVINAIGIQSTGKGNGRITHLEVTAESKTMRLGDKLTLNAAVYDDHMQPISADKTEISFFSDKKAHFEGNTFVPEETGVFSITAALKGVTGNITVKVKEAETGADHKDIYLREPSEPGFTVGFFGDNGDHGKLYTEFITSKRNAIASKTDIAVFRQAPAGKISTRLLIADAYSAEETPQGIIVCLNNSKGSYTSSDVGQLARLDGFLKTAEGDRVFVIMQKPFFKTDPTENEILIDMLKARFPSDGIFIISFGKSSDYKYDDGIRYITVNDLPDFTTANPYDAVNNSKYGLFTLNGDGVNFEFKSYFKQ